MKSASKLLLWQHKPSERVKTKCEQRGGRRAEDAGGGGLSRRGGEEERWSWESTRRGRQTEAAATHEDLSLRSRPDQREVHSLLLRASEDEIKRQRSLLEASCWDFTESLLKSPHRAERKTGWSQISRGKRRAAGSGACSRGSDS